MSTRSFFGGGIGREIACFSPRELTDFHAMQKIQVKVTNALGVHARPSAKIAHLASRFTCSVWIAVKGGGYGDVMKPRISILDAAINEPKMNQQGRGGQCSHVFSE